MGRGLDVVCGDNWASIVAHEAYRSGQLSGPELRRLIDDVGLKSVVNLRGANPTSWYRSETAACRAAGVRHYDVAMSARELPEPEVALGLLSILREAPRPLLVHCRNGADRAGLAAAIYLIQDEGLGVEEAEAAGLSTWRGHVPFGPTGELGRFLGLYRTHGSGKSLEQWTREDYPRIFRHEWCPARS
ncbi:MAG: tyrosine-protein phosphatase [Phycisphaerales bacterium]